MRAPARSCARATLAAFFVWWELLGAQPLMPDFLGGGALEDQGGEVQDYLGRVTERAFKSPPALPAGGGPAPGVAAAPSTIGGAGTAAPAVAGSGGRAAGAAGPTTLAQIAQALGLSVQALKATDWARRMFGDDAKPSTGAPPGTAPDAATGTPPLEQVSGGELGFSSAAELEQVLQNAFGSQIFPGEALGEPSAVEAGAGAGGTAGVGTGLGIGGGLVTTAGQLSGNKDVTRAGQGLTAVGAGAELGAGLAGAGSASSVFALPALGYTGMNIADQVETDARIKRDVANAKNVLGAKVPSAVSRLGKTLNDISTLDPASATTEQLLAAQQSLQAARTEFNAVDHAFKGALSIAGKPVDTGLSLEMVKPQLDALNESQLRIQDALESRGVKSGEIPGYQSPQDWLNFLDSPLYQQYTTGTPRFDPSTNIEEGPADQQNPEIAQALKGIQPGQTESGLRALIGRGLPARVPRPSPEQFVGQAFGGDDFAPVVSAMDAP